MCSFKNYTQLQISTPSPFIVHVVLNRPSKRNALDDDMWFEIKDCFEKLSYDADCRVIVLSGEGKMFCAGIDLMSMSGAYQELEADGDLARKAKIWDQKIPLFQDCLSALEKCSKPVLAAVHSACIGAGVDIITAADIRYCTKDAYFQVKEVDIGMAADVGTLQRLPKVIGSDSLVRELCYTARELHSDEALSCGLVSKVFDSKESLIAGALDVAKLIASKSPVGVQGTKKSLVYSRDHTVQEGLDHIALWNRFMLQSEDLQTAVVGAISKEKDIPFSKL
nr:delta(3,5)-Delta(2,4)-dienoyl-CoA isomerase, mitochondrial-like isoform X2 [Onthophagus taurus]